jgi:hypothetical protein
MPRQEGELGIKEATMAHEIQNTHRDGHIENVCLTGPVVMGALCLGIAITSVIFWWALFAHH